MEEELKACCDLMLQALDRLRDTGKITQEEYERNVKIKLEFLCKKISLESFKGII